MKEKSLSHKDETLDVVKKWGLRIMQKVKGYRFSIDSLILAELAQPLEKGQILDLGTGCGIVALILAKKFPKASIKGVEIQKEMVERAKRNAKINNLEKNVEIVHGSYAKLSDLFAEASFDYVISNPPYRQIGSGRINPYEEKAVARHEIFSDLFTLLKNAYYVLKPKGKLGIIFTARRITDLLYLAREVDLEPKKICFIHSFSHEEAQGVFVESVKGAKRGETIVKPPLVIYESPGVYTKEAQKILIG